MRLRFGLSAALDDGVPVAGPIIVEPDDLVALVRHVNPSGDSQALVRMAGRGR